jgi:hypothetical protein
LVVDDTEVSFLMITCADGWNRLGRLVSIGSRASSTGSDFHTHDDERPPMIEDTEEEAPPRVPMMAILKKNKPEWPFIVVASVGSIVIGFAMPVFGILFGDILGVSK